MRMLLACVLVASSGCVIPKIVGDSPLDDDGEGEGTLGNSSLPATGGSSEESATEPGPVTGDIVDSTGETLGPGTTTGDDTGPAMVCPTREGFTCAFPTDCEVQSCDDLHGPFDAEGCPKVPCDDGACGEGEVCYRPGDWFLGCSGTLIGSKNNIDICDYKFTNGCDGGNYCVPEEVAPPATCPMFTDEASCLAAGCSEFTTVRPVLYDEATDTCSCGEPRSECLWFLPGWLQQTAPGPFYRHGLLETVAFSISWEDNPYGWIKCTGDPAEPDGCLQCAEFAVANCI